MQSAYGKSYFEKAHQTNMSCSVSFLQKSQQMEKDDMFITSLSQQDLSLNQKQKDQSYKLSREDKLKDQLNNSMGNRSLTNLNTPMFKRKRN